MSGWTACVTALCTGSVAVTLFASHPGTARQPSPAAPSQAGSGDDRATVTFSRDIAPILFEHCAQCHRPGGSSGVSLLTYDEARQHARQLAAVTASRVMPPWKPEPGYGEFEEPRRLTDSQIGLFKEWADRGALEGDRAQLPPVPHPSSDWRLGQPDLVLTMPVYRLRSGGRDTFRNFVIPVPTGVDRYVRAWEFRPGNPRLVHHATMQIDPTQSSRLFENQSQEPGYEGLIAPSARAPDGFFLDWAPGHGPAVSVEGTAWPLPKDGDLVMMLHLRPSGKEETVQASVGLYFSDEPPARLPVMVRLTRQHLDIPAGDARYQVTDSFTTPVDLDVYTVQPHAHYLAREMRGFARLPDQTTKPLIFIRQWDFDWQEVFHYTAPVFLPAGTTVVMEYTYDNSRDNLRNPNNPPRRVTYGQQTSDEMAELWFQVVPRRSADREILVARLHDKVLPEEIEGRRMMAANDPGNVALHDDLALLYADIHDYPSVANEFRKSLQLRPASAAARYNVGAALLAMGQRDEARGYFERALEADPGYAYAHYNLGLLLQAEGRNDDAIGHYRDALRERPADLETQYNLGVALALTGGRPEAVGLLRQVLLRRPDWPAALGALAWILAVTPDGTGSERDEAVDLAQHAVDLTEQRNAGVLDILATALAATGKFDRAVTTAERAVAVAEAGTDQRSTAAIKGRLELFRRRSPYYERH